MFFHVIEVAVANVRYYVRLPTTTSLFSYNKYECQYVHVKFTKSTEEIYS
jgi:hypothetical protein